MRNMELAGITFLYTEVRQVFRRLVVILLGMDLRDAGPGSCVTRVATLQGDASSLGPGGMTPTPSLAEYL